MVVVVGAHVPQVCPFQVSVLGTKPLCPVGTDGHFSPKSLQLFWE